MNTPTNKAGTVVIIVAQSDAFLSIANSGNNASPSCEIALAINAANGIIPFEYNVTNITCGPQPGIIPISAPTKTANNPAVVITFANIPTPIL